MEFTEGGMARAELPIRRRDLLQRDHVWRDLSDEVADRLHPPHHLILSKPKGKEQHVPKSYSEKLVQGGKARVYQMFSVRSFMDCVEK